VSRAARLFLGIGIALIPMVVAATVAEFGVRVGRANAGWSIICSILLLGMVFYKEWELGAWGARP